MPEDQRTGAWPGIPGHGTRDPRSASKKKAPANVAPGLFEIRRKKKTHEPACGTASRCVAAGRRGSLPRGSGGDFDFQLGRRLGQVLDPQVQVRVERRARRDQVAEDHVLLEADQRVDRSGQRGFSEDLGGLLEAGRGDERFALQRRLGDAQQQASCRGRGGASCPWRVPCRRIRRLRWPP